MALDLFVTLHVRDHDGARDWYVRFLGAEPTFVATPTESVWQLAEHRWLVVEQVPEHAGHGVVTIFRDDLDAFVAAAGERGVAPDRRETYEGGVTKTVFRDPDGNEVGLGGPLPA
ncbi:VOC family protein [Cellulosimicrobium sp. PMB13]|uniref:VOC family protein n=1 Tax=Cellulosimicrobium sp. PMB13 TaxID=3120158 RepID=UPI003F4B7B7D